MLLLSGPAGAGKSSTAREWADTRSQTTAWVDCDAIRGFVRAGRSLPDVVFDIEAQRQWNLAMSISAHMAQAYVDAGMHCVVDVYAPPPTNSDMWDELSDGRIIRVDLVPTLEACRQRNSQRSGRARISDEALVKNYETYAWCLERAAGLNLIDNTHLTLDETVERVAQLTQTF